jgi:hypothetical protein
MNKSKMININKEYFNSPYYFLIREKTDKYSLYFSISNTLSEARDNDEVIHFDKKNIKKVKNHLNKTVKSGKNTSKKKLKKELEELVADDGSMLTSKIPILDNPQHTHRTMDQIVPATRQTNDPVTRGYRTYYGESIDDEISEVDLSGAFGYEETKNMDGKKTYKYMVDKLGVEPDEAKERTKQFGKDPYGKSTKKKKKGSIDKMTLSEFKKRNLLKMVEDLLVNKNNDNDIQISKDVNPIIQKNIKMLKAQAEKNGLSLNDLIKMLKSE